MRYSLAAQGRGRFGRLWLTRTADAGPKRAASRPAAPTTLTNVAGRSERSARRLDSETAVARVPAERPGQLGRLDLSFERGDSVGLAARLAVDRILQSLQHLLQMRDPLLERVQVVLARVAGPRSLA